MTTLASTANPAPAHVHDEDDTGASLLAEWARDRVLEQHGAGADATEEQRQAYNRAAVLYGPTRNWDPELRATLAARQSRQRGWHDFYALAIAELEALGLDDDTASEYDVYALAER